jgi:cyanophycin synthetase
MTPAAALAGMPLSGLPDGIEEVANQVSYRTILDETEAIETALDEAPEDALVVILPESVSRAIRLIQKRNPLPEAQINSAPPSEAPATNGNPPQASGNTTDQYAEAHT